MAPGVVTEVSVGDVVVFGAIGFVASVGIGLLLMSVVSIVWLFSAML